MAPQKNTGGNESKWNGMNKPEIYYYLLEEKLEIW